MKPKIAILITTFLRDNLLYKTIQSIINNCSEDYTILIADQGYNDEEKLINIDYYKSQIPLKYYRIPFDAGLSVGRNFLVQKANEMSIPYCLLSSDSIQFTQPYDFKPVIEFLETGESCGIVGFDLEGSKCPWEYNMEITPNGIKFTESTESIKINSIIYKKIDICRNIFLAKTHTIIGLWDEDLKLGEHEMAFIEYKKRNYEVYWTDSYLFKKSNLGGSDEYKTYRGRLPDYLDIVKQKLGISGWVIYPPKIGEKNVSRKKSTG